MADQYQCVICGRYYDPTLAIDTKETPKEQNVVPGRCPYCRTPYRAPEATVVSPAPAPSAAPAPSPFLSVSALVEAPVGESVA